VLSLAQALAASAALEDGVYASVVACLERFGSAAEGNHDQLREPFPPSAFGGSGPGGGDPSAPCVMTELPDLCVLWKPPGWTVTVSDELAAPEPPCERAFAGSGRPLQDWVADTLGYARPIMRDAGAQFGLVHRLDRDTSGAIVCATTYRGYLLAQLQFTARRTRKIYVCLCRGEVSRARRWLDTPLRFGRCADGLWRSSAEQSGKPALTEVLEAGHLTAEDEAFSLVRLRIHTGRQHQIRAHLAALGHPLAADALYGGRAGPWCTRSFLHAERLSLDAGSDPITVFCRLPGDLRAALAAVAPCGAPARCLLRAVLGVGEAAEGAG